MPLSAKQTKAGALEIARAWRAMQRQGGLSVATLPVVAAPCDDCAHAARCRAQALACAAYRAFEDGESEKQWRRLKRMPSAAI